MDSIQQCLAHYACDLRYDDITAEAKHAAKVRVIDTLGALFAGFFAEPCRISRNLAARMPDPAGATIIGTRMKTAPDLAAFVNGITARYIELTDNYQKAGSFGGHPSDVITPLLGVAEFAHASGRDLITSVLIAYETYTRLSDGFDNMGFDHATFNCLGVAMGAGKLLGLSVEQLSHCIAMAIVPNNILRQVRTGHMSMFKATASGQAARAGVYAALLARAGMEGPPLPFEGKAGWCDHVARKRFDLDIMRNSKPCKILDTSIKLRPCGGLSISSVLAAEKVAPLRSASVKRVVVEVYKHAWERAGSGEHRWNPDSRETADHSIPYLVAATLMDGTVNTRTFDDAHLWNPELRAVMKKIEVIEDAEFTNAFERLPQQHRTRVTVVTSNDERLVGESGGEENDLATQKSAAQIVEKFRGLTEDTLGSARVTALLERLWHLDEIQDMAELPPTLNII